MSATNVQAARMRETGGFVTGPLLERERHLQELAQWLAAARNGGRIALVGGEAGLGKTSLMQEFARQQRKTRVLWGACDSLFTPRPLAPLHDIARQARGGLLTTVTSATNREVIFNAALDELEHAETLVVFEDVHWADEATLDLLKFLGRRIHRTKALLAITYRDDEVHARHPLCSVLGDLPRADTHRMLLSPLSESAVADLARRAGRGTEDLHRITGGNPLFVTEVLAEPSASVPATVRDAVLARASQLSAKARAIAEVVSVIPARTEAWLVKQAVAVDDASVEECLGIGMIRDADGALSFRHELTRRAFQDSLSKLRQLSLHAKVFGVLAQRPGVSAARITHHANGAENAEAVLRFAPLAATQAASVRAHREAAAHYRTALRYEEKLNPEQRARLLEALSYECYLTNQIDEALATRREAAAIWRTLGNTLKQGDSQRWLSRLSWFAGVGAEAMNHAVEAIDTLERLPAGPELAMAYSNRAQLEMLAQESSSAIAWADRTLALAEPWGNWEIVSHSLNNRGSAKLNAGDVTGYEDLERSLRIALEGNLQEHVARAYTNLTSSSVASRNYELAQRYAAEGIAYCEEHDLDSWVLYMTAWRARLKFELCDWDGAGEDAQKVLQNCSTTVAAQAPALIVLGQLRTRRGDPQAASALNDARTLVQLTKELQRIVPLTVASAEAAWLAGDPAAAVAELLPVYERALKTQDHWIKSELAAWLQRLGAWVVAPEKTMGPYALELIGKWQEAALAWEKLGCRHDQAEVLARYGGEPEKRRALEMFEELGSTLFAQALRRQMRLDGVRRIPRGSRRSTRDNSMGLTQREAQIFDLMSQGLRNSEIATRLFVSTRTVDHHVSAILTKLGVPSRAAALAMAHRSR
jgi:ATP/maltotriose-dependent transcriptional regulator MalT